MNHIRAKTNLNGTEISKLGPQSPFVNKHEAHFRRNIENPSIYRSDPLILHISRRIIHLIFSVKDFIDLMTLSTWQI